MAIGRAALRAVDAAALVRRALSVEGRVHIVGAGKAAAAMARGAEDVLGDRIVGGVVVVKDGHGLPLTWVEVLSAGHPVPDARSEVAGRRLLAEVADLGPDDVVVGLWSGGGSALIEVPAPGWTLDAIRARTEELLRSGSDIATINAERVGMSAIKGGKLAAATRARWVNLVLSDVAGDDPARVASGPAVRDGDGTVVIGRLADALEAARAEAFALRYGTVVLDADLRGEAREAGARLARAIGSVRGRMGPMALLLAGEPTVTVRGDGRGGRMQELALSAALGLEGTGAVVLALGTDGGDGPTDAAGALVDAGTIARGRAAGLDPVAMLDRNDSYPFLDAAGDLVRTGPTRTNVGDLVVALLR